jgi:hypothetical protein
MGILRNRKQGKRGPHQDDPRREQPPPQDDEDESVSPGYNPNRDEHLYWLTEEGYIIAQDVACQHDYVEQIMCQHCGGQLIVAAHLNRSGQGLSELVALCSECRQRDNFIFDISNDVYQTWWAEQLGPLYIQQYDGPPREPHNPG